MKEKIVKIKHCKQCNSKFSITDKDLEFYKKVSPNFGWKVYEIPTPTLCPECRNQRRLSFRNERKLYKRKCNATGKDIISVHVPDANIVVYDINYWWSDKWDILDYGQDFDFNELFFKQFWSFFRKVPRQALYIHNVENSPYSNFESDIKDCYLTIWWHWNEKCMYWTYYIRSNNCIDNYWLFDSNISYENLVCYNLYKSNFLNYSNDCENCYFWFELKWCKNCIWCIGLNNKQYYIFNKEYSKEDYKKKLEKIKFWNYNNLNEKKNKFEVFLKENRNLKPNIISSENCSWNDIYNSKNSKDCFALEDCENCKYSFILWMAKNNYDMSSAWMIDFSYEMNGWWMNSFHNLFSGFSYNCTDIIYSDNCHNSKNLFACIGLRNKQYCILNKQYTKEEYEKLVPKIIRHMKKTWEWWEFFPASISPFWYNETVAQEYFPLIKKEAIQKWFNWSNYEVPDPKVKKIIPANKLPNNIVDIPDDILNWAIRCEVSWKPFRIIKPELEFYRKYDLPIPRKHPDVRHLERMKLKNLRKLYDRKCNKVELR